jgi:hypothetical protein
VSSAARIALVAIFFVLVTIGILLGGDRRDFSPTTFGKVPRGHGAVYDLLRELELDVVRTFAAPEALPPDRTVWWIQPDHGCAAPSLADEAFSEWIAEGGRAVVFLPARADACAAGAALAGLALPARDAGAAQGPQAESAERSRPPEPGPRTATLAGPLLRAGRALELPEPVSFLAQADWGDAERGSAAGGPWEVAATLDGRPFALARTLGAGRLLVLADGRFLENRWLDHADAAPLAVDVALALGTPWIDERAHGLVPSRGTLAYLVRSPALLPFAGLALLALAFVLYGAAEPRRRVGELDPSGPTLETYVRSMAALYAGTGDNARVLARYRELTARRLRRRLGLPPDAPLAALADRLARRGGLSPAGLAELRSERGAASAGELARAAARLDRLVEEADL